MKDGCLAQWVIKTFCNAIYTLHLSRLWINPIDLLVQICLCKDILVLWTKKIAQVNAPVSVILSPPVEVDVKTGLYGRFDQTHALDVSQVEPPLYNFQTVV